MKKYVTHMDFNHSIKAQTSAALTRKIRKSLQLRESKLNFKSEEILPQVYDEAKKRKFSVMIKLINEECEADERIASILKNINGV